MSTIRKWIKERFSRSTAQAKPVKTGSFENEERNGFSRSVYRSYSQLKSKIGLKSKKSKASLPHLYNKEPVSLRALLGLDVPRLEFGLLDKCEQKEQKVVEIMRELFLDDNNSSVCLDASQHVDDCNLISTTNQENQEAKYYNSRISIEFGEEKSNISPELDSTTDDNHDVQTREGIAYNEAPNLSVANMDDCTSNISPELDSETDDNHDVQTREGNVYNEAPNLSVASMDDCTTSYSQDNQCKPSIAERVKSSAFTDDLLDPDDEELISMILLHQKLVDLIHTHRACNNEDI